METMTRMNSTNVSNLWLVTPRVYRSAQPDPGKVASLAQELGFNTVIDLCGEKTSAEVQSEHDAWKACGVAHVYRPMDPVELTPLEHVLATISTMNAAWMGGILVHCKHGEDRTGVIAACWELLRGADMEEALRHFYQGHTRGIWGEYWMTWTIRQFHEHMAR